MSAVSHRRRSVIVAILSRKEAGRQDGPRAVHKHDSRNMLCSITSSLRLSYKGRIRSASSSRADLAATYSKHQHHRVSLSRKISTSSCFTSVVAFRTFALAASGDRIMALANTTAKFLRMS